MPLLLNTYEHGLIQLNDANPIPANTENITLIAEFPQLSENDFMKNWGTIDFVIQDEEQTFKGRIEDKTLIDVFAGYHLKTPPPRITKAPAPPIASPDKTKNEQGSASQQPVVSGDDNVVSFNQSGGQTARTIINNGPPPPELRGVYQGHRRNQDGTWNVVVMAQVVSAYPPGMLNLQIAAPNLLNVDIIGQDVSMTMFRASRNARGALRGANYASSWSLHDYGADQPTNGSAVYPIRLRLGKPAMTKTNYKNSTNSSH